jgi:hypothetical protein
MSRLLALSCCACALALCCLPPGAASAADGASAAAAGDKYVFGTELVLASPKQLAAGSGYWADQLPKAFNYSQGSIVDEVNRARAARGVPAEIDVATYPVEIGVERQRGGKWEYNINFHWMTPEDVDAALAKFPLTGKLAGLARSYRPLGKAVFFSAPAGDGTQCSADILGAALSYSGDDTFNALKGRVVELLKARFGDRAKFDLSVDNVYMVSGTDQNGTSFSLTVYLDGAESQELNADEAP